MTPFKKPKKPGETGEEKEAGKGRRGDVAKASDVADRSEDRGPAETGSNGESPKDKPSAGPESRRRDGQRKLQAALERADEAGDGPSGRKGDKGRKGRAKRVETKEEPAGRRRGERARARTGSKGERTERTAKKGPPGRGKSGKRRRGVRRREGSPSLKRRARAALRSARGSGVQILAALATVLAAGAALLFALLGRVLAVLLRAWLLARPPARTIANRVRRTVNGASRLVTPKRALVVVVAGAAVLLALSQWADYRGVSIGTDAYSGLEAIAPPPEVERAETGDPHAYVFVPVGLLCLGLLAVALRGRPGAARLIALAGAAAVLVALIVDRSAGLDVAEASMSFEGVEAKLLGGFYAQIAAGLVLVVASLLLGRALAAEAPAPARRRAKAAEETSGEEGLKKSGRRVRSAEA